jgi:hypothetical protein
MPASAQSPEAPIAGPAELARACNALWLATLSLMTAYMQTAAPAHRFLLARRVATNFRTLQAQDCYDGACRARFARLALRWQGHADAHHPDGAPSRSWLAQAWRSARETV